MCEPVKGREVYNLAADMGGMGFIERFRIECLRSILINTHMIEAANRYPDKTKLLETILALRAEGMSYREIAHVVGIHFTRVQQIFKTTQDK